MRDLEELARQMREAALGVPEIENKHEPYVIYDKIYEPSEEQKKLYFNAGRWAGGARDYNARQCYLKLRELGEY